MRVRVLVPVPALLRRRALPSTHSLPLALAPHCAFPSLCTLRLPHTTRPRRQPTDIPPRHSLTSLRSTHTHARTYIPARPRRRDTPGRLTPLLCRTRRPSRAAHFCYANRLGTPSSHPARSRESPSRPATPARPRRGDARRARKILIPLGTLSSVVWTSSIAGGRPSHTTDTHHVRAQGVCPEAGALEGQCALQREG